MNKKEIHLLFTGDSITDGNRYKDPDKERDLNHQIGHSFVYVINALLGSLYPEKHFHFTNRGVSGNRAIDVYSRLDMDFLRFKPDIASFLLGINDGPDRSHNYHPTSPKKYAQIYRLMLSEILETLPNIRLVICEPFVLDNPRLDPEFSIWNKCIHGFQEETRRIAKDYDAVFVPLQEIFDTACQIREPSYWSWDGVHPTESGHGLIARQWLRHTAHLLDIPETITLR